MSVGIVRVKRESVKERERGMIETMGKPDKDLDEAMKHICDVMRKRIDDAYKRGINDGSLDVKQRAEGAYQKGFNDGKEYGLDESDMREAVSYQRGLDDAWEAAKKILQMYDFTVFGLEHDGVFESPLNEGQQMTPQEAIEKLKAYEEKQKADDEIKVGDEVEVLNSGSKYLIAWILGTSICGFAHDGVTCRLQPSDVRKTGRHFDIDKILEEMKE
jgi:transcription antitermination factor NusG